MKEYEIEVVFTSLEQALEHAKAAGLDVHFTSEVAHLIATAKANKEENE